MSSLESQDCMCQEHRQDYYKCAHCVQIISSAWSFKNEHKALTAQLAEAKEQVEWLKSRLKTLQIERQEAEMALAIPETIQPMGSLVQKIMSLNLPSSFFDICNSRELSLSFLMKSNLIPHTRNCTQCTDSEGNPVTLRLDPVWNYSFVCPSCQEKSNIRTDTLWNRTNLPPDKMLLFMLLWTVGLRNSEIARLIDGDIRWVRQLSGKFRKLTGWYYLETLPKFTGIVEIDESNFFKRKLEVGKALNNERWVFGLYNRGTKLTYMEVVPKRTAKNLLPIIQQRCDIGTTIISDQWAAYEKLEDLGFPHYTVDHSRFFVNPNNREIHSQHIESSWCWAKYEIKRKNRTGLNLQEYLNEFCWRRQYKNKYKNMELADVMKSLIDILQKFPTGEIPEKKEAAPLPVAQNQPDDSNDP